MTAPMVRVDPGWLRLRGPADARARERYATGLVEGLDRQLSGLSDEKPSALVDVGAGTGAGADWLRARLTRRQDWRLLDHDPQILAAATEVRRWARSVVGDVRTLHDLLRDEPADAVTCQALLDVLTTEEVESLVAAAASCEAALLLSLSVTGDVTLSPALDDDDAVADAFNAHQRRDGRLGPDACEHTLRLLHDHGYDVTTASTPWELGPAQPELLRAWLQGRLAAAVEQDPGQREGFERWWRTHDGAARRGELTAEVGHLDILALPTRQASA